MATSRRRIAVLLVTVCLGLAACNGNPAPEPTPTSTCLTPGCDESPTTSPTPTPTPTTAATAAPTSAEWDPPDPITADYSQLVLNELLRLETPHVQAIVDTVATGSSASRRELAALEESLRATRSATHAAAGASTFSNYDAETLAGLFKNPVGQAMITDVRVLESTTSCILAETTQDSSAYLAKGGTAETWIYELRAPDTVVNNPTGWLVDARSPADAPRDSCT